MNRKLNEPILQGKDVTKVFGSGKQKNTAVNKVDFDFYKGEIVSLVGESGSGKTTLAKMILGLTSKTSGEIIFEGKELDISSQSKKREYWKNTQAIFQDPFSTFNIFRTIDDILISCIKFKGGKNKKEDNIKIMQEACSFVNLEYNEICNKYPFELSGGQLQRLMIARIFMLRPKILIADEPTSMIDASSRATILDMLLKIRKEIDMTIILITHDIGLAYYISDTVYIMEKGIFVEHGDGEKIILNPKADYTKRLINDVPKIHSKWN